MDFHNWYDQKNGLEALCLLIIDKDAWNYQELANISKGNGHFPVFNDKKASTLRNAVPIEQVKAESNNESLYSAQFYVF